MRRLLITPILLVSCSQLHAQLLNKQPAEGGSYAPEKIECISAAEYQRIHAMLARNKDSLIKIGVLQAAPASGGGDQTLAGTLIWPVTTHNGLNYNSVYGVSNYVDHNASYPNQIQDWNCGNRSYDLSSGYNHAGIDIFTWPFGQQLQENDKVAIIAAVGGTIIGKDDGYADHSCSMTGGQWNAVYIQGTDGNTYWYGHMKKHSLTSKPIGASVTQGEFLGIVGSSGNSTGPHLHFEMYDVANNLRDPFEGPCNNLPSLWADQKPYFEPTINHLATHYAQPEMPNCPQLEEMKYKNYFQTGDLITFAVYMHDQSDNELAEYEIIAPDNTVFDSWTHQLNPNTYYVASWWIWNGIIGATMNAGEWKFRAKFAGQTTEHRFYVNVDSTTSIVETPYLALGLYPNPTLGSVSISGLEKGNYLLQVYNILGSKVMEIPVVAEQHPITLSLSLPEGQYFIRTEDKKGRRYAGKLIIQ